MRKLLAIFFLLLFSFCSKKSPYPHLIVKDVDNCLQLDSKEMIGVEPEVFGHNFTADTDEKSHVYREFEKSPNASKEKRQLYLNDMVLNENYIYLSHDTIIPRADLKIIVDTTYTIPRKNIEYKNHTPTFDPKLVVDEESDTKLLKPYFAESRKLRKTWVECYPVLIFNNSKKATIATSRMIQEAKDEKGHWHPIEFMGSVGFGGPSCIPLPSIKLFSQHYFGTSIIKYHGNFKTKLRVKYLCQDETYYSNEFSGYINKSQFVPKPFLAKYNFWKNPYTATLPLINAIVFLNAKKIKLYNAPQQ